MDICLTSIFRVGGGFLLNLQKKVGYVARSGDFLDDCYLNVSIVGAYGAAGFIYQLLIMEDRPLLLSRDQKLSGPGNLSRNAKAFKETLVRLGIDCSSQIPEKCQSLASFETGHSPGKITTIIRLLCFQRTDNTWTRWSSGIQTVSVI